MKPGRSCPQHSPNLELMPLHPPRSCALTLLALATLPLSGLAATSGHNASITAALEPAKPATLAESLENLGRIYQNKDNPILQEFWLLGRYHGQQHYSDGNTGQYEESYETRRLRMGFQAKLFNKLTLHAQMVSARDVEPFYGGFTELWVQWAFHEALQLTVGQQKHRFTHDRNISSRYINYLERSMFTNMIGLDYTPAVTLSGKFGKFNYYTGFFSNATGPSMGNSFTKLNSGLSFLASVTYDMGKVLGADSAHLITSYLRSDASRNATNLNRFEHGIATALVLTDGPVALVTELTSGLGGVRGDAHGLNFQPSVFLTDKLQLVGRYQLAISDQANGLRAQSRYERNVGLNQGSEYRAGYAGLNYHIAAHRIKLMTGVEYAKMDGRDVWTGSVMVRVFWGPHSKGPFPMAQTLNGIW